MLNSDSFTMLVVGRRFLDLFAGSGQIGLEALSRGAREAVFVDSSRDSIRVIEKNVQATGFAERAKVIPASFESFLLKETGCFDIAFIDPPYAAGLLPRALELAAEKMSPGGVLICEHGSREEPPREAAGFILRKTYRYGKTSLTAYEPREA